MFKTYQNVSDTGHERRAKDVSITKRLTRGAYGTETYLNVSTFRTLTTFMQNTFRQRRVAYVYVTKTCQNICMEFEAELRAKDV